MAPAALQKQAKVLSFGPGSVGSVYIYQLLRADCDVTAVCRSNYSVVKDQGFRLSSKRFGNVTYNPDRVIKDIAGFDGHPAYDYILVTSKAFPEARPSLSEILRPVVRDEKTAIVLAQNGLGIEDEVALSFPRNPVISGVVYLPATQIAPGVIEYPEMLNLLHLGTFPASAPPAAKQATQRFADLMIAGGGGAKVHEDIQVLRWQKLLMNGTSSPICALTLCTDGDFLNSSDSARDMVWEIMLEILRLARALDIIGMDEEVARAQLKVAEDRARTETGRAPSMLQDVRQRRPFEVEAILGNPVRLARELGVPIPRLETLYTLLKGRLNTMTRQGM